MVHFIRGFFDGDGGLSKNGQVSFMANLSFVEQIKQYLILQIDTPNNAVYKHCKCDVYFYGFSGKSDTAKFFKWLYANNCSLFLNRKKQRFESLMDL